MPDARHLSGRQRDPFTIEYDDEMKRTVLTDDFDQEEHGKNFDFEKVLAQKKLNELQLEIIKILR